MEVFEESDEHCLERHGWGDGVMIRQTRFSSSEEGYERMSPCNTVQVEVSQVILCEYERRSENIS